MVDNIPANPPTLYLLAYHLDTGPWWYPRCWRHGWWYLHHQQWRSVWLPLWHTHHQPSSVSHPRNARRLWQTCGHQQTGKRIIIMEFQHWQNYQYGQSGLQMHGQTQIINAWSNCCKYMYMGKPFHGQIWTRIMCSNTPNAWSNANTYAHLTLQSCCTQQYSQLKIYGQTCSKTYGQMQMHGQTGLQMLLYYRVHHVPVTERDKV